MKMKKTSSSKTSMKMRPGKAKLNLPKVKSVTKAKSVAKSKGKSLMPKRKSARKY